MTDQRPLFNKRDEPELRSLALKIAEGKVYGTWSIPSDLIHTIFIPLFFMKPGQLKGVAHAYAVVGEDKTASIGVNGYPIFFSCRTLSKQKWKRLIPLIKDAKEAREKFLKDTE